MGQVLHSVTERTNDPISFTIFGSDGVPLTPATLTMMLTDHLSGTVIRAKANALNTGGVTVADGVVTWQPTPEEHRIINDARASEPRVMLWEWTWSVSGTTRHAKHEIVYSVHNLANVP